MLTTPLRSLSVNDTSRMKMRVSVSTCAGTNTPQPEDARAAIFKSPTISNVGRDGSVGTATRYGLDGPGIACCGCRFKSRRRHGYLLYVLYRKGQKAKPGQSGLRSREREREKTDGARFSTRVQTCPGAHSASYTMDTRSLSRGLKGRGVALKPTPKKA